MIYLTTYACGCQVRTEEDGQQVIAGRCGPGVMCCRPIHLDTANGLGTFRQLRDDVAFGGMVRDMEGRK